MTAQPDMQTLTAFILARVAEDEAAARSAEAADIPTVAHAHIARHDPARALRWCDAVRRIVAEHETMTPGPYTSGQCALCTAFDEYRYSEYPIDSDQPCPTLRALALTWSDHPEYRQEWAP